MREQSWLGGELLQQAQFAGAGLVVVQLHLVCQTPGLAAALKYQHFYLSGNTGSGQGQSHWSISLKILCSDWGILMMLSLQHTHPPSKIPPICAFFYVATLY